MPLAADGVEGRFDRVHGTGEIAAGFLSVLHFAFPARSFALGLELRRECFFLLLDVRFCGLLPFLFPLGGGLFLLL